MSKTDPNSYKTDRIRRRCFQLNLEVDEPRLGDYRRICAGEDVSQEAFSALGVFHAETVKFYFTPSNYTFWQRVKFALFFLKG